MNIETKKQIAEAADKYIKEQGVSQNDLAKKDGISYLSRIINGYLTYMCPKEKIEKEIKDMYFESLAKHIGFKKEYWHTVNNVPQFQDVISELIEAKENSVTRVIFGAPGSGKTFAVEKFYKVNPVATFVITCFRPDKLKNLVEKIERAMNLDSFDGDVPNRIDRINEALYIASRQGHKPVIIFDEAENLTATTLPAIKDIYDAVFRNCGIVLIGTNQLKKKLDKMKEKDKDGIPQLYSRLKAGFRHLNDIDRSFDMFFKEFPVNAEVKKTLLKYVENYRELNRYLEDAFRQADEMNLPLTDELFRQIHKLPLL